MSVEAYTIGFIVLVLGFMVTTLAMHSTKEEGPPPPCKDYTYSMSTLRSDVASCPGDMTMVFERRYIGKDLVHCSCKQGATNE